MDNATYKARTSAPDVMRRSELLDSAAVLRGIDDRLAELVVAQTRKPPLEKPVAHTGGPNDDFFEVGLSEPEVDEVVCALMVAEGGAVADDGTTTLQASSIGSLVDLWCRFHGFIYHET